MSHRLGLRLLLLGLALAACTPSTAPPPKPVETSALTLRWNAKPDAPQWTAAALAASRTHGLDQIVPEDIDAWCPGYRQARAEGRQAFWAGLMSALAKFESSYDPTVSYTENFVDSTGQLVVSRGLLQLSRESAKGYGCAVVTGEELHDPSVNLDCAARILKRLVGRDGRIASTDTPWLGAAKYWSPFRAASKRQDMADWTRTQPFCAAN